jgi:hypothetical protein
VRLHIVGTAPVLACVGLRVSALAAQGVAAGPASLPMITELVERSCVRTIQRRLRGAHISRRKTISSRLLESTSSFRWQAVANLLLMTKPPGFARRLLNGLRLRLTIYVTDQERRGFGSGLGGGSEKGGSVAYAEPAGVPPLADYQFAGAMPGATVLTLGPRAVLHQKDSQPSWRVLAPLLRQFAFVEFRPGSVHQRVNNGYV